MKGYTTNKIIRLLEKRSKMFSQMEVVSQELTSLNKDLGIELVKTYGGKILRFRQENSIAYFDAEGNQQISITPDIEFTVIEIRSANTFVDILYVLKKESGEEIVVKQEFFHSFDFVE